MKKRYKEFMVELGGVPCVIYLIKIINKFGKEYFVPKISRTELKKEYKI